MGKFREKLQRIREYCQRLRDYCRTLENRNAESLDRERILEEQCTQMLAEQTQSSLILGEYWLKLESQQQQIDTLEEALRTEQARANAAELRLRQREPEQPTNTVLFTNNVNSSDQGSATRIDAGALFGGMAASLLSQLETATEIATVGDFSKTVTGREEPNLKNSLTSLAQNVTPNAVSALHTIPENAPMNDLFYSFDEPVHVVIGTHTPRPSSTTQSSRTLRTAEPEEKKQLDSSNDKLDVNAQAQQPILSPSLGVPPTKDADNISVATEAPVEMEATIFRGNPLLDEIFAPGPVPVRDPLDDQTRIERNNPLLNQALGRR